MFTTAARSGARYRPRRGAAAVSFNAQRGLTVPRMSTIGAGLLARRHLPMLAVSCSCSLSGPQPRTAGAGPPTERRIRPDPCHTHPPQPRPGPASGAPAQDMPAATSTTDP